MSNSDRRAGRRCTPYGRVHPPRHAAVQGDLRPARGPDRRARRARPAGDQLRATSRTSRRPDATASRPAAGSASPTSTGRRRWSRRQAQPSTRALRPHRPTARSRYQADYPADAMTVAPGASGAHRRAALFAGAKEVAHRSTPMPRRRSSIDRSFDLHDRLGLVLLHHQADVLPDRLAATALGNFGLAILLRDRHRQGCSSSRSPTSPTSRWQDEEGAAEDAGDHASATRTTR